MVFTQYYDKGSGGEARSIVVWEGNIFQVSGALFSIKMDVCLFIFVGTGFHRLKLHYLHNAKCDMALYLSNKPLV